MAFVMPERKKLVLNVSADPLLRDLRGRVLEAAGFAVVSATNLVEVVEACEANDFSAVVLGHTIPDREKRRIIVTVRESRQPETPVIALYEVSPVEANGADLAVLALDPGALVEGLKAVGLSHSAGRTAFGREIAVASDLWEIIHFRSNQTRFSAGWFIHQQEHYCSDCKQRIS